MALTPTPAAQGEINRFRGTFGERAVWLMAAAAQVAVTATFDPPTGADGHLGRGGKAIAVQVKTTGSLIWARGVGKYPLEVDAYNWARDPGTTLRRFILVVETRPAPVEWLVSMDWGLIVRRRVFVKSLAGAPVTTNTHSVTLDLSVADLVTPASLQGLVEQFG